MYNIAIKSIDFIRGYTPKQIRLENISRCNYFYAVKRHDWRYRLREMFEVIGLPLPECLHNELTALEAKATEVEAMDASKFSGL